MPAVVSFAEVAAEVQAAAPRLGPVRLVSVDGPAGSGKTTLAGRLVDHLEHATLLHMDDLYEGWTGLEGVTDRLVEWVLAPLRSGRAGRYRRYDWHREEFAEWHDVPLTPVLVVEGVGSAPALVAAETGLLVWVQAPEDIRLARGEARDGTAMLPRWRQWLDTEAEHHARERARERADLIVDGAPTLPHDPEVEVVACRP